MYDRFDITPKVSIIGPAADLLIVLQDLYEAFSIAEEYHEEYGQWENAHMMRRIKDMIDAKITAIEACEIIHSPERPGERRNS